MAAMLHARNNTILFLWDKMLILMQNIFIVPAMQHGRHAKPLYKAYYVKHFLYLSIENLSLALFTNKNKTENNVKEKQTFVTMLRVYSHIFWRNVTKGR